MKPRIYTYKITFPHQGWWYWGWHKEKEFGENYSGSPKTHKEKWNNFEWEMQILEFFDCEVEAQKVEKRLIRADLDDPLCLNENVGGVFSTNSCVLGGKIQGRKNAESGQIQSIQKFGCVLGGKTGGRWKSRRKKGEQRRQI